MTLVRWVLHAINWFIDHVVVEILIIALAVAGLLALARGLGNSILGHWTKAWHAASGTILFETEMLLLVTGRAYLIGAARRSKARDPEHGGA